MPARRATAWKVIGVPSPSSSRSARWARSRIARRRWAAAARRWSVLRLILLERFEAVDDPAQVGSDRLVHLDEPLPAVGLRLGDELLGALELIAMGGEELGGGEEVVAGQARVRVRAGLLKREAAVAVGERLLGAGE